MHATAKLVSVLLIGTIGAGLRLQAQASAPADANPLERAGVAFRAGSAAQQAGRIEEARSRFAEAVRLAPAIAEAHQALGAVLLELDRPADAIAELEAALKLKPEDSAIETDLALAYSGAGQPASAIPYFQAVYELSLQPGQPGVGAAFCESYARALAAMGKREEAISLFRAAEERGGAGPDLDDAIGSLYVQLGNWNEARSEFERAIAADAKFAPARIHLGILLRQQHDLAASVSALNAAVELDPANSLAQLEYGRSLAAAGKDEDALPHLQQATQLQPDPSGSEADLAMALQRLGREQDAVPWFQKAIEREPHNPGALTNLGLALTMTGKAKEALSYFQRALAESPKDAVIEKDLGVAHVQLSAFDEAIGDFQAALALDPNDPQLHYDLGLVYKFKDRMEDAIAELSRAGQMDPTLQDPPYTLGILYMQMGKLDDAAADSRRRSFFAPTTATRGPYWAARSSRTRGSTKPERHWRRLFHCFPASRGRASRWQPSSPIRPAPRLRQQRPARRRAMRRKPDSFAGMPGTFAPKPPSIAARERSFLGALETARRRPLPSMPVTNCCLRASSQMQWSATRNRSPPIQPLPKRTASLPWPMSGRDAPPRPPRNATRRHL